MPENKFLEMKSDLFTLRKLKFSDWEVVSYLRSDETVNKYVERPSAKTQTEALAFINRINDNNDRQASFYWCISNNDNGKMIGSICLWNFSEDRKTAEVGYDLHPAFQGKGIMQAALDMILNFGFQNLNLERVEAFTHRDNASSRRLLERNNFVLIPQRSYADNKHNVIYEYQRESAATKDHR